MFSPTMNPLLLAVLTAFPLLAFAQTNAPAPSGDAPTIPVERHAAITGQGYFPVAIRLHDGRIAVVMRDPNQCIPSVLKLVEVSWRGKGWRRADYETSLRSLTEVSFDTFSHPRDVLARHPETPQVVVDYRELTTQPRKTVLAVYEAFNMPVSPEFDAYLRAQEDRERSHSTRFEYSIDDYELSRERIEAELSDFYHHHGWPRETQS